MKGGVFLKVYTVAALARRLNMTERNVRLLRDKGVLTEYKPGIYDLQTATIQYINFLRQKNPEAEEKVDYNTERAKLVRAKRESEELELQIRKNELHTTVDIEKALTDILVNFRTKLMAVPAKLSPIMAKKKDETEIFKLMKAAIDETLEELSDFDKICKEDKGNEG